MYEGGTTAYGIHTSEEISAYTDLCSLSNTKKSYILYTNNNYKSLISIHLLAVGFNDIIRGLD